MFPRIHDSLVDATEADYGSIWFLDVDDTGREWLSKWIDRGQVLRKAASAAMRSLRAFYGPGYGENDWLWTPDARLLTVQEERRKPMQWRLRGRNVRIPGTDVTIDGEEDYLEGEEEEGSFDQIRPYTSPVTF
jgi:hypothetical protein